MIPIAAPSTGSGALAGISGALGPVGAGIQVGQGVASLIDRIVPPGLSPAQKMSKFQDAATKAIRDLDSQVSQARADGTLDAQPWLLKSFQDQASTWAKGLQQVAAQNGKAGTAGLNTMSWLNNLSWAPPGGFINSAMPTTNGSTPPFAGGTSSGAGGVLANVLKAGLGIGGSMPGGTGTGGGTGVGGSGVSPAAAALLAALGFTGSALTATKNTTNQSTSSGNSNISSSSLPQTSPEFGPLKNILLSTIQDRISGGGLPAGTLESGINNINQTSDLGMQGINNGLTARGLSGSPIAGNAILQNNLARQGQISTFQNVQIPQMQNAMQLQNLGLGAGLLGFGQGTINNSTGSTSSNTTGTGTAGTNPLGAGLNSGAGLLALLYGMGSFNNKGNMGNTNPLSGWPGGGGIY